MRDPNRILIIVSKLITAWTAAPDLRLGQLICNAHASVPGVPSVDLFYAEDDVIADGLDRLLRDKRLIHIAQLRGAPTVVGSTTRSAGSARWN